MEYCCVLIYAYCLSSYKLTIDPNSSEVLLAPQLESTSYFYLNGVAMSLPEQLGLQPDARAIQYHYDQFMKLSK